jgi:hypothetical protein
MQSGRGGVCGRSVVNVTDSMTAQRAKALKIQFQSLNGLVVDQMAIYNFGYVGQLNVAVIGTFRINDERRAERAGIQAACSLSAHLFQKATLGQSRFKGIDQGKTMFSTAAFLGRVFLIGTDKDVFFVFHQVRWGFVNEDKVKPHGAGFVSLPGL